MGKPRPSKIEDNGDGTSRIILSCGENAIIDTEDKNIAEGYGWFAHRLSKGLYVEAHIIGNHKKCVRLHRLVLKTDAKDIDHINGNPLDNRKCNLRPATRSQNIFNQGPRSDNKLGIKGVCFHKDSGKYLAQIRVNCKNIYLGIYRTAQEAADVYAVAAQEYFGEFTHKSVLSHQDNMF